ncbi:unnamed protein product [Hapterophycus canaliculatus]
MQLAIRGFVALSRYLFNDESLVDEGGRRRYLFPRDFSQAGINLLDDAVIHEFLLVACGGIQSKNYEGLRQLLRKPFL